MHIIRTIRTKETFCGRYTRYTKKLLSISLQAASVNACIELNDRGRCFDFTDGFKHSELSYFALLTSVHQKKSKGGHLPGRIDMCFSCRPKTEVA